MKIRKLMLFITVFFLVQSCKKKDNFDSDYFLYRDYITSFTSGAVSANADIKVGLTFSKTGWLSNQEIDQDAFSISPAVDGKVVLLADNVLAFHPDKKLEQDKEYQVTLHLSKLTKVPSELSDFNFTIKTVAQDFVVELLDLQSHDKNSQFLNAVVRTADNLDIESVKKLVTAHQDGRNLPIIFNAVPNSPTEFFFVIDKIERRAQASKVTIFWNGDELDISRKGSVDMVIPQKEHFKVVDVRIGDEDNQSLLINFSDPVKIDQNFIGLVELAQSTNLQYAVEGNVLKVFFDVPLEGKLLLEVFQGIESADGQKTEKGYAAEVNFEQMKPAVKFSKSGTILPGSSNLKVNFEAVNLSKVDVRVYRIFENNVLQFLQDNEMNTSYDLRKVALPIAKKTLELTANKMSNFKKWNSYALDLSTLITPEQGAIYRVEFTIKKSYSLYTCDASTNDESENANEEEESEDFSEWGDYDYYYDDYDWSEREDPCSRSYFSDNKVATNILATDLGVIAKRGENNSYFFAVSNIITTDCVSGATIDLYNLQRQKLASYKTGSDGTINFHLDKKAYFAVVKKDKSTTYLKLADGNSQSVSSFDVDGEALQKGLKGFIYGERGVWRPGDSLFLSFVLNDKSNKLPATHPIKLKLSDPNGKVVYETVSKYSPLNHYRFKVNTHPNAPTGSYEAVVSVGGAKFYKSIKIETIKPNRLRIKNGFEGKTISAFDKNEADVQVSWLHGAVAKGLKLEMQAKFTSQKTVFKNFEKYIFDDPSRMFSSEEVNIFSGNVNENGFAKVAMQPKLQSQAPGMLKAAFITKAYENGGDFSTDVITATYSPYQTYVGIKPPTLNKYGILETNKTNTFDIVTVTESGKPKPVTNLEVKVYKVEWRWWWDASNDDLSSYSATSTNTPYFSTTISTDATGKARFNLKIDEDDWGRYLVRVSDPEGGHAAGETAMIDWPSWSGKTKNTTGTEATMLMFTSDKTNYAVGEKAIISFPSSAGSRALISLENGSQVVQTLWAETKKGETQVQIPITAKMAPNIFIHITLLQPHASTVNDAPIRLYGIIPIEVVDKNTQLQPQLSMPEVLKPEQTTTIKVSEKTGKAMTYTIAVVDEGLLDLTRFKTPDAWSHFYSREALGVKTWDIYDEVIGAYGGKVNQIFSIGGDEDLGGGQSKKANRFKPVVIYLGPFTLPAGQTKVHQIKLPKYVGSVRTMVVAANAENAAYGTVEKTTPVRSPLMILASLPRKVSPGEKVTLPVTVFAMENQVKNVTLQLKTNKGFRTIGQSQKALSFTQPDEKIAYFDLEAADIIGIGKVTVVATSGKERASFDVELDVINPNPVTQEYKELILKPNATGTINWSSFGVAGSNNAKLEVSSFPSIDFNRRLDFLTQYPHGCVEQTTSGAFPQLYLADIADIDAVRKQKIQRNVTAAIQKLSRFQMSSGGFGYWPGEQIADDWGTTYVGHFMIEAERKGYAIPPNFRKSWISHQSKVAKQWRYAAYYQNDFPQAYRLYTLALAGAPDLSSMNRLRETQGISNDAKLRLAAAYVLAGQKNVGLTLLNRSEIEPKQTHNGYYYYFGSEDRNRAMTLETLVLLGKTTEAFKMANKVAKDLSSNQWMSTQTTAFSLYAMSKFAQQNGSSGIDVAFTSIGVTAAVKTQKGFADRTLAPGASGNAVSIRNNKNQTLYVKVSYSGILPIGKEQTAQRNVATSVVFKDRKGKPINISTLAQGTEFVAEVTVKNTTGEAMTNFALTQIIPSGWEIVNTRFTDFGSFAENKADYTDIRDDRTNFYFGLQAQETRTFKILLNASYMGKYYLPGAQCEAMYDNSYFARTKGQWVNVVKE